MTATTAQPTANAFSAGILPRGATWAVLGGSWLVMGAVFGIFAASGLTTGFNIVGAVFLGTVLFDVLLYLFSRRGGGAGRGEKRVLTPLLNTTVIIPLLPLISLAWIVMSDGIARFDPTFFTQSMRNITGGGGGALHAIIG